jgi:signal transduction histidine kinase
MLPALSHGSDTLTVNVDGKIIPVAPDGEVSVPPSSGDVTFRYVSDQPLQNSGRLRFKLDGFDDRWRHGRGEMFLAVRFLDAAGDQIAQTSFPSTGESPAWSGDLARPTFTRRRETLPVPPNAASFWIVISSAGPPPTLGLYAVKDLEVARIRDDGTSEMVSLGSMKASGALPHQPPEGWIRDGVRRNMAKVIEFENAGGELAFAIEDDDPTAHAEWHMTRENAPRLDGARQLSVQWNELHTIGVPDFFLHTYGGIPPGEYTLRVQRTDLLGMPIADALRLRVRVRAPLWQSSWFWVSLGSGVLLVAVGSVRYRDWRRMRREIAQIKQEQALDRERIRIAQDIHDDLGARATHILLLSAVGGEHASDADKARGTFEHISKLTHDLVFALYQTVWAVNPEHDHLPSLTDHLCQIAGKLCAAANVRCRLQADRFELIPVSSEIRHHISMAVSEAIHNAVKHAHPDEITLFVTTLGSSLEISVRDDGHGFDAHRAELGHGIGNMRARMEQIGGAMTFAAAGNRGTTVQFKVPLSRLSGRGELEQIA